MSRMRRVAVLLLGVSWLTSSSLADEVYYFDADGKEKRYTGNVREETKTKVVIQTSGGQQEVPINRLSYVNYESQPPEMGVIRGDIDRGLYDRVLENIKKLSLADATDNLKKSVVAMEFKALAEMAIADPSLADAAFKFLQDNQNHLMDSRHHYPVYELVGRVHLAKGDYERAAKAFGNLNEVDWPGYKEKAAVYQGIAALLQGKHPDALALFEQVIGGKGNDRDVLQQKFAAMVYKGRALVESGKAAEAEAGLRKALEEIPAETLEIKAVGHNALGDALQAQKKSKDALLDGYMWVVVVYNKHPKELARAMYHASQILPAIGFKEKGASMATMLKDMFPTSEWSQKLSGAGG